jgi:1,4-alpha-glucan branching enzyme
MKTKQTTIPDQRPGANSKTADPTLAAPKPAGEVVLFEYLDGVARRVCLAGSFNNWKPEGGEMIRLGDGKWFKELVLPPGAYEYRLVVDGKWMADPAAGQTAPNPFGGANSLRIVTASSASPGRFRAAMRV